MSGHRGLVRPLRRKGHDGRSFRPSTARRIWPGGGRSCTGLRSRHAERGGNTRRRLVALEQQVGPSSCIAIGDQGATRPVAGTGHAKGPRPRELEMVLPVRIELTASPLPRECSTTELRQQGPRVGRNGCKPPRPRGEPRSAATLPQGPRWSKPLRAVRPLRRRHRDLPGRSPRPRWPTGDTGEATEYGRGGAGGRGRQPTWPASRVTEGT